MLNGAIHVSKFEDFELQTLPMDQRHGKLACNLCRTRKVKCDRTLPACAACIRILHECTYPQESKKPGPKLGSTNVTRKRKRESRGDFSDEVRATKQIATATSDLEYLEDSSAAPEALRIEPNLTSATADQVMQHAENIQSLSFIIHPSYETCSPQEQQDRSDSPAVHDLSLTTTCDALGVTPTLMKALVDIFFTTYTSFRLFRPPTFWDRVKTTRSSSHFGALLAAMAAFAAKQWDVHGPEELKAEFLLAHISSNSLIATATRLADQALSDCGDDMPPLFLIQALVLISHWLLLHGVRGRAWRYLGTCVRIAYETNLHLIDTDTSTESLRLSDPTQWCDDEEKRRVWWAIWEMDVFASVVRRCPTAINWSQNETFLPAEDEHWNQGRPQRSCVLEHGAIERCKALKETSNRSPRAWFIVINSIMREAQVITSPVGVRKSNRTHDTVHRGTPVEPPALRKLNTEKAEDARKRLEILSNAARYFSIALPPCLKYHGQYLSFEIGPSLGDAAGVVTIREHHSAIYSIHLMMQLCGMMIHKYQTFRPGIQWESDKQGIPSFRSANEKDANPYFAAADAILKITHKCHEMHYRYVNPLLANTVWLAAAIQLLRGELATTHDTENELVKSNFAVLSLTYDQFAAFWKPYETPKQNLATLERYLAGLHSRMADVFVARSMQRATMEKRRLIQHQSKEGMGTTPLNKSSDTCLSASLRSSVFQPKPTEVVCQGHQAQRSSETSPVALTNLQMDRDHASRPYSQLETELQTRSGEHDFQDSTNTGSDGLRFLPTPEDLTVDGDIDSVRHCSPSGRQPQHANLSLRGLDLFDSNSLDAYHFEGNMELDLEADVGGFSIHLDDLVYGSLYVPQ